MLKDYKERTSNNAEREYRADNTELWLIVGKTQEASKKEENLAMNNWEKWQEKPVAGESTKWERT